MAMRAFAGDAAAGQVQPESISEEVRRCEALTDLDLEDVPGGPALITGARMIPVPAGGLEMPASGIGGFAGEANPAPTPVTRYCDVTGYVAPQNRFELKLPPPGA